MRGRASRRHLPSQQGEGNSADSLKEPDADVLARRARNPSRDFHSIRLGEAEAVFYPRRESGGCWRRRWRVSWGRGLVGGGRAPSRRSEAGCLRRRESEQRSPREISLGESIGSEHGQSCHARDGVAALGAEKEIAIRRCPTSWYCGQPVVAKRGEKTPQSGGKKSRKKPGFVFSPTPERRRGVT